MFTDCCPHCFTCYQPVFTTRHLPSFKSFCCQRACDLSSRDRFYQIFRFLSTIFLLASSADRTADQRASSGMRLPRQFSRHVVSFLLVVGLVLVDVSHRVDSTSGKLCIHEIHDLLVRSLDFPPRNVVIRRNLLNRLILDESSVEDCAVHIRKVRS